jgi:hypothetical protein
MLTSDWVFQPSMRSAMDDDGLSGSFAARPWLVQLHDTMMLSGLRCETHHSMPTFTPDSAIDAIARMMYPHTGYATILATSEITSLVLVFVNTVLMRRKFTPVNPLVERGGRVSVAVRVPESSVE